MNLDTNLIEARNKLYEIQGVAYEASNTLLSASKKTSKALEILDQYLNFEETDIPNRVKRGYFFYDRQKELARILRTREIIETIQPCQYEDASYLTMLAYQAASIEFAIPHLQDSLSKFNKYILGTIHSPEVNAFAQQINFSNNYTVIALNSGLIDFIYQAAKAVVEALNPERTKDERSYVNIDTRIEMVRKNLLTNPAPIERIYRTLENYFFKGYPRAYVNEEVKDFHAPVLSVLVPCAERWIIAHEYGHGLAERGNFDQWFNDAQKGKPLSKPITENWAEEYFADDIATILTILSAASLDGLPPEASLTGGNFTLACFDILKKSHSIVTSGQVTKDVGSMSHPPYKSRAKNMIGTFLTNFNVKYGNGHGFSLELVPKSRRKQKNQFDEERFNPIYIYSKTLYLIWDSVRHLLSKDFHNKRKMHHIWD